jgi:hypothetical protein
VASGVQVHDFNPGIAPNGLFWTQRIPPQAVAVNFAGGSASMHLDNWAVPDFHDIFNSIGVTQPSMPPIPSIVSFDIRWSGKAAPVAIRDATNRFVGSYIDSLATIAWSASQPSTNFAYQSDPAATSTTVSGVIGQERNGVFFNLSRGAGLGA